MMRRASCAIVLALFCRLLALADGVPSMAQPLAGKFLHILGGMTLGLAAAGVVDAAMDPAVLALNPWMLPASALAASALGGISKEILDSTGFGDPQFTDILITSAGGVAAALMLVYAQTLYLPTYNGQVNSASLIFSLAALFALPVINGFMVEIGRYEARRALPSPVMGGNGDVGH
jgi:hypothetical protein